LDEVSLERSQIWDVAVDIENYAAADTDGDCEDEFKVLS
jgi:hypothetical protein